MTYNDLIAIVHYGDLCDPANGQNETLRRINDGRETVNPHTAKVRNCECAALKFLRLHPFVARAVR